ncbi:transposase [Streptomyces sp. NPDC051773]|uniref:transposase n=1 Tax=Streptomyces sp. NPDC051773 TaxID=3156682 RepID=UPI00342E7ED8
MWIRDRLDDLWSDEDCTAWSPRDDFTYALGLDLDDRGFHHSVLSAFRDRLAEGDRADRLLGLPLTRIRRAGLLKGRATQRTDSTHVLSAARELTRLDLVPEAVRAVLEEGPATRQRCWMSWPPPNGPNATAGRFACAPSPATPSPAWSTWATPANCCNASTTASH